MTDLQFSEQANRQQIQPSQQQHGGEDHHGAVFHHYVRVAQKFLHKKPRGYADSAEDSHHPHGAEEVKRPAQILEQEANGDQVKKYPESTRDSVVRSSALAVHVANWYFADRSA